MKRREFLKTAGGVSLASVLGDFVGASEPAPLDMGSLFEANSPEVLALAQRVADFHIGLGVVVIMIPRRLRVDRSLGSPSILHQCG